MNNKDFQNGFALGLASGGTSQVQSDWEENDSSKGSYVKNRTHWKEENVELDYLILEKSIKDPYLEEFYLVNKKVGIVPETVYTVDIIGNDEIIDTIEVVASSGADIELPEASLLFCDYFLLYDGIYFDISTETFSYADSGLYYFEQGIDEIHIHDIPTIYDVVYHKIPKDYLPKEAITTVDQKYKEYSINPQSGIAVQEALDNLIIQTSQIEDGAITNAKVQSINGDKLERGSVWVDRIADGKLVDSITTTSDTGYISVDMHAGLICPRAIVTGTLRIDPAGKTDKNLAISFGLGNQYIRKNIVFSNAGIYTFTFTAVVEKYVLSKQQRPSQYYYTLLGRVVCGDLDEEILNDGSSDILSIALVDVDTGKTIDGGFSKGSKVVANRIFADI